MNTIPIPAVLECMRFIASSTTEHRRRVKNYEFDLYLDENHKISLDGVTYPNTDKCLIFRKPGQYATGTGNYNMLMLTLDFSHSVCDEQKLYRNTFGDLQPLCNFQELGDIPPVFRPQHFEEIKELMEELSKCSYPNIPDCTRQARLIKELLLLILYDANKYNRKLENTPSSINPYVKKACEYIAENFDKNIDLDNLSDFVYLNKNYLIKLFNKELGQSPKQYLLEMRLLHARKLLLETNQSIQEIAFSCGFNTPSYFSKKFKNQYGVLPAAVRKKDFRI